MQRGLTATRLQRTVLGATEPYSIRRLLAWLAVLLAFRVLALVFNATDLFFDEAQYWTWSRTLALGYFSKPPLIAWVIRLTTSICSNGESCVRSASPVLYTATSLLVYLIGRRLYDARTGFFAALVFATLPGVSFSAGIISTDVPLLLFWTLALLGFVMIEQDQSWKGAAVLGLGLGFGLLAKYAMALLLPCAALYLVATPARRPLLGSQKLWAALLIGLVLVTPNLAWNAGHNFATFSHTADNAKWGGSLFHPDKGLEFFAAQLAVFGPILFVALLIILWRALRTGVPAPDRMLLFFSIPIVLLFTAQAVVSRAHANWGATAYVAASVVVTATMLRDAATSWFRSSFWLHGAIVVLLAVGNAAAQAVTLPLLRNPYDRTLGWHLIAEATRERLKLAQKAGRPFGSIVTDDRAVTAELLYYLRHTPIQITAWKSGPEPHDHYELTRPFTAKTPEPVLLVSLQPDNREISGHFRIAREIGRTRLKAGRAALREVFFLNLQGYKQP